MNEPPLTHIDPTDYPRDVIIEMANEVVSESGGTVELFFKSTCSFCSHRNMFEEPYKLFERAICSQCGKEYEVHRAGYALIFRFPKT